MKKQIIEDLRYSANLLGWLLGNYKGNWSGFNPDKTCCKVLSLTTTRLSTTGRMTRAMVLTLCSRTLDLTRLVALSMMTLRLLVAK